MQTDRDPDEAVALAAEWLARNRDHHNQAIVADLKKRFGITAIQAVDAIRLSHKGGVHAHP